MINYYISISSHIIASYLSYYSVPIYKHISETCVHNYTVNTMTITSILAFVLHVLNTCDFNSNNFVMYILVFSNLLILFNPWKTAWNRNMHRLGGAGVVAASLYNCMLYEFYVQGIIIAISTGLFSFLYIFFSGKRQRQWALIFEFIFFFFIINTLFSTECRNINYEDIDIPIYLNNRI